jgi:hypothetical protein
MAFEVASVKPGKGPIAPSNPSLTPWDDYSATGGLFRADSRLLGYIQFAYKRALLRVPSSYKTNVLVF